MAASQEANGTPGAIVAPDEAGQRVDAFLARRGLAPSVAAARRLLAQALVRVDGRLPRKGDRLRAGQRLELQRSVAGVEDAGEAPRLIVLHEDAALVAVAKPAGVPSQSLGVTERGTIAAALVGRYPECATASLDPREGGLGHRLDTGTSGVLVAARSREAWEGLRRTLGGGDCEKIYVAEVVGSPALGARGETIVDAPIGRVGRRGDRVRVGQGRGLLTARTTLRLLERRGETSLVEARLARGRAHQVRAHLAHVGCPVLGDVTYGNEDALRVAVARGVEGFRLHAWRIRFVHPVTGRELILEAPLPGWAAAGVARG